MNFQLRNISKIRKCLNRDCAISVVTALVTSHLDYANSLLAGTPDSDLHRLQVAQHNAARIICGARNREHITPYMKDLHWLPVKSRMSFKILCNTYNSLYSDSHPVYLKEFHTFYSNQRSNLRSADDRTRLLIPKFNKRVGQFSYPRNSAKLWNNLPVTIRQSNSYYIFKRKLKTHLFGQCYD
ncbi:hypothetical protein SNE40_021027 [Patella caerulea]|uniref:Uncharacterized protein n=1 Tax=Patella caerulea TaxID=87958 RepID=A0AAN8G670_PATCE